MAPQQPKLQALHQAASALTGVVKGWKYRVYGNGLVKVGTAAKGQPFAQFTFRLTSYDNYDDVEGCIEHELTLRAKGDGPLSKAFDDSVPAVPDSPGTAGLFDPPAETLMNSIAAAVRTGMGRSRHHPDRFSFDRAHSLRDQATGKRKISSEQYTCRHPDCKRVRLEKDSLQRKLELRVKVRAKMMQP